MYLCTLHILSFSIGIKEASAFGLLPSFGKGGRKVVINKPTITQIQYSSNLSANIEDNVDVELKTKDLFSLLDEAVLLHTTVPSDEVQILIEEIAHATQKVEHNPTLMKVPTKQKEADDEKRTLEEVRNELDEAVLYLQTLSLQDDEEKWTKEVEKLAFEYHELLSLESYSDSSEDSSSEDSSQVTASLIEQPEPSISIDDMIEGFESKLEKLHAKHKEKINHIPPIPVKPQIIEVERTKKPVVEKTTNDGIKSSDAPTKVTEEMISGTEMKLENRNLPEEKVSKPVETFKVASEDIDDHKLPMESNSEMIGDDKSDTKTKSKDFTIVNDIVTKEIQRESTSHKNIMSSNIKNDSQTNHKDHAAITNDITTKKVEESNIDTEIAHVEDEGEVEEVDIAIIGAGIGGLCAGSILNTLYDKKVGIFESHYLPGGCAHAFPATAILEKDSKKEKITFTFDSGPTIVLGCSSKPYNPLRQVLNAVGVSDEVEWIPYQGWGMVENPSKGDNKEIRWPVELGPDLFENGPLEQFGGEDAVKEFQELRRVTKGLVSGAVEIPAMAMRSGKSALIPLLRYLPALSGLIKQGEEVTQGTFGQFMDGPKFEVKNQWLRDWLDALAFSLSGLPACRTSAAAMAYVIYDMHREGAALDYPRGGLGAVIDALVKGVEQGSNGSSVNLRQHVESIDTSPDGSYIQGITLKSGKKILANDGVICNAPVWSLNKLVKNDRARSVLNNALPIKDRSPRKTWSVSDDVNEINYFRPFLNEGDDDSLLAKCDSAEMTGSFLHLHLAIDAKNLDLESMEAHYTVMDRGLGGDGSVINGYSDGPCAELNMIAVSNPCVLDRSLAPPGYIVVHAYGAGNEPYELWEGMDRKSQEYKELKESRADALWRAVESIIPDIKERVVLSMIGSPITHERFLRRPKGTYGAATEDYLKDGSTPYDRLILCGDGVFPGIGIPAVALSGASAANSMISPWKQWRCLDSLKSQKLI